MTQLAMLDEEKEDREIPSAFVPQLRDYGLAGDSARNDTARWQAVRYPNFLARTAGAVNLHRVLCGLPFKIYPVR